MSVCAVLHCKNNRKNVLKHGKSISFHRITEVPELKREWAQLCHFPEDDPPTKQRRICSEHFLPRDFAGNRLINGAVPSKQLPGERIVQQEQLEQRRQLTSQNTEFKKKIAFLEVDNAKLRKENEALSQQLNEQKSLLAKILTPLQVHILSKGLIKAKWTEKEISRAILLKKISSKAYELVRSQWNIPLPCSRTIRKWCSEIDFQPGILHTILRLLKEKFSNESSLYHQCILGLDEMSIDSEIGYDSKHDIILGPHKKLMVVCIRGLFKSYKQPIYFNFDVKLSKEWLFEIMMAVETYGFNIQGLVCDSATTNMGLFNSLSEELKITEDNPGFLNPATGEEVLTYPDLSHLIKLFRNNTLDNGFKLSDGTSMKKKDFDNLIAASRSELNAAFKITEKHVKVEGRERQRVNLAYQFFSETTGKAFERYFSEKPGLAKFVLLMNDASDVLNSRVPGNTKNWKKSAYGKYLEAQDRILDEFAKEVRTMRKFTEKGVSNVMLPCQKNTLINIASTKRLLLKMKRMFNVEYLLTSRLNQDYLENMFGCVRGLGIFNQNPSPVECINRLKTLMLTRTLSIPQSCSANTEKCWDGDMQAEVLKYLMQKTTTETTEECYEREAREAAIILENLDRGDSTIITTENWTEFNNNLTTKEMIEFGGEEYLAGYVASKLKDEHWMKLSNEDSRRFPESWTQFISHGNLCIPSYKWMNLFRQFNSTFILFHKNDSKYQFNVCRGVIRYLQEKLILEHPEVPIKVIKTFVRVRTFIRLKYLNNFRTQKSQVEYRKRLLRSNF